MVAGFSLLVGIITNSFRPAQAEDTTVTMRVGGGSLALTIDNSGPCSGFDTTNNTLDINVINGSIASNCIAVTASTNAPFGYTLSLVGPEDLTTSNNLALTPTSGTMEHPTVFASQHTGGVWGFAIPNSQIHGLDFGFDNTYQVLAHNNTTNTARFAAVPTIPTAFSTTDAPNTSPDTYNIFFAVATGQMMPTGEYRGVVTVSATANVVLPPPAQDGDDIQTVTLANCPTTRTRVIDARDGNSYWVRRINGTGTGGTDLCWMETNLAYRGGGNNQYGDATPALNAGTIASGVPNPANTGAGQVCRGDNASMNIHQQGCFWEPTGSNITVGSATPSESVNGIGQFGLLYNWCAAMNGQPEACQTTAATQPNQNVNGSTPTTLYNICPKGWRLPTGEPATSEFTLLNNAINGGLTNSSAGLLTASSLMFSGFFSNGSFVDIGSGGYYWSSTVSTATGTRILLYYGSIVFPATFLDKGLGFAVRCVAP